LLTAVATRGSTTLGGFGILLEIWDWR